MKITTLKAIPQIDTVLQLQREMSLAANGAELTFAFARHFGSLSGISHLLRIQVKDLEQGEYRLMDWVYLFQKDLSLENIQKNNKQHIPLKDIPVHRSSVISKLIENNLPAHGERINPHEDEILSEIIDSPVNCLSLPIFTDGTITEWIIACREPGIPLQHLEVLTGISNMNMLSRYYSLLQLNNEIKHLNVLLDRQVQEVGRVQQGLLPQHPPEIPGLSIAFHYESCEAAGGDYFDFHQFTEEQLGVVIADVSGHGPRAAVVMAMLRTAVSTYRVFERPTEKVVEEINMIMRDGLRDGNFVTAVFLGINFKTGEVDYANAGHPYPRLRRCDGSIKVIDKAVTPPLGILDELEVRAGRFHMQPGDLLFLYTDGLNEAFSASKEQFGTKRLDAVLMKNHKEPEKLLEAISTEVHHHVNHNKLQDDLCMVAIRYGGDANN